MDCALPRSRGTLSEAGPPLMNLRRTRRDDFLDTMDTIMRVPNCARSSSRILRSAAMAVHRLAWNACCGFTLCRTGSLKANKLGEQLFAEVDQALQASGMKLNSDTIVDATRISTRAARAVKSTRCNAARTATSRRSGLGSSICSRWASVYGDSRRCAIAVWQRMQTGRS